MVESFSSGTVFKKEDAVLDAYLAEIVNRDKNALYLVDNQLRPEVVPAMVGIILSIKQDRMVKKIQRANFWTQVWFGLLAIGSLAVGVLQLIFSYHHAP